MNDEFGSAYGGQKQSPKEDLPQIKIVHFKNYIMIVLKLLNLI